MSKLIWSVLLKNEKSRYLPELLDFYGPLIDGVVVMDNGSTDGTFEYMKAYPKLLAIVQDLAPFSSNETYLRKRLWELTMPHLQTGDWVLAVDADELLEPRFAHHCRAMLEDPKAFSYSFKFAHFWASRTHYRVDGAWGPRLYGHRMWRYDASIKYIWPSKPFACGSTPVNILRSSTKYSPLLVQHLGYANPADIEKKYKLYSQGPAAPYHASAHVQSIVTQPILKQWVNFSDLVNVTIGCPIRDRAWMIKDYLRAIYDLNYPKDKIGLLFLVNDSTDATKAMLLSLKKQYEAQYRFINVSELNLGSPPDRRNLQTRLKIFRNLANIRNHWLSLVPHGDYAFSLDSDIIVKPYTLQKLVQNNVDICSAFISNEFVDKPFEQIRGNILKWNDSAMTNCSHILNPPKDKLIPVDVTGAVYLLSPAVVKTVQYNHDSQGEDIAFCRDAARKGFKAYCDTSEILTHVMDRVRYSSASHPIA